MHAFVGGRLVIVSFVCIFSLSLVVSNSAVECLKCSVRGGGTQLMMVDRAAGGHEGKAWGCGIF